MRPGKGICAIGEGGKGRAGGGIGRGGLWALVGEGAAGAGCGGGGGSEGAAAAYRGGSAAQPAT